MPEKPPVALEHTLMGTDDAMTWAQEFCRIFNGKVIVAEDVNEGPVTPGTMVGWFANAMAVGESMFRQRSVVTAHQDTDGIITIQGDLPTEVLISAELLKKMVDQHNESLGAQDEPVSLEEKFREGFDEGRVEP
jgi:hypothetical protein